MDKLKKTNGIGYLVVSTPILFYWVYWTLNPSYWFNGDPAAFYFIDSLSVFTGGTYVYVDHPGTPIQVLGSLMLAITYPFFGNLTSFINFYINRPEAFFLMAHTFLLITNLLTAIVFYDTAYTTIKTHRVLGAIALTLAYFFLHPHSFPSLTFWSHNSINYSFGTLWLLWLYRELRQEKELPRFKLILLGLTAGILAIAQVYFFVWVASGILIIFLYYLKLNKPIRQAFTSGLLVLLGNLTGIASMLIPIYRELPRFATWLARVISHKGLYGTGEAGIYSLDLIPITLGYWWANIKPIVILLTLCIIVLGWSSYRARQTSLKLSASTYSMTIGMLFHITLLLIVVGKAGLKLRYTLSLAATIPILILLVIYIAGIIIPKIINWTSLLYIIICVGVVMELGQQIDIAQRRSLEEADARLSKSRVVTHLAKDMGVQKPEVVVVFAYGVPVQCSGMLEASAWTGYFKREISAMCPNQHVIFDTDVELNSVQPVTKIENIDWDLVIWPGNGSSLPDYLDSIGAVNIPKTWYIVRSHWYYIHPEFIKSTLP